MSIPGPRSRELARTLETYESRNVTFVDDEFPVFWERASGATIVDVDGNRYTDLTAAFGVANSGHSNPRVVRAIATQAERLMHSMGDVHPTQIKAQLLEQLAKLAPGDLSKTFLASTGAEAIEAAMKTAVLATGKTRFAAFRNAYHGLSLGSLQVSGLPRFREPFAGLTRNDTVLLDYPDGADNIAQIRETLAPHDDIAAVFVEPLQGRGGCIVPPEGWLSSLRELCSERGMLLVLDEIYTGFGRTGAWFAALHEHVVPDIMCVGKAMANGFPVSATIARPGVMDAWPASQGEALHTSTYLGNPMACAAALANIAELRRNDLPARARDMGARLGARLQRMLGRSGVRAVRGRGLMWGIELESAQRAESAVKTGLQHGLILLQAGPQGNVLSLTPPLVIDESQLLEAIDTLEEFL